MEDYNCRMEISRLDAHRGAETELIILAALIWLVSYDQLLNATGLSQQLDETALK